MLTEPGFEKRTRVMVSLLSVSLQRRKDPENFEDQESWDWGFRDEGLGLSALARFTGLQCVDTLHYNKLHC